MPPGPATIDLGVVSHDRPPEPAPPWPARERLRRLRRRFGESGTARAAGVAAGVAAGLALVLATAGAAPSVPPLVRQYAVDAAYSTFAYREQLYTVRDGPGGHEVAIASYRLDGGELRWETTMPGRAADTWLTVLGGALVVYTMPGQAAADRELAVLDDASGELLWSRPGAVVGQSGDTMLVSHLPSIVTQTIDGRYEYQDEFTPREITAVDPATGTPRWTVEVAGWAGAAIIPSGTPSVVIMSPAGELASYALATGDQLATASVGVAGSPASHLTSVLAVGSTALVTAMDAGQSTIIAYDPASLTELWTFTHASDPNRTPWATPCGALICVSGLGPPRGLDPGTGRTVWTADWFPAGAEQGPLDLLYDPRRAQLGGHLLLAREIPADDRRDSWLIDPRTGEPVLAMPGWSMGIGSSVASDGAVLVLMPPGEETTWVGRIRPDLAGVDPLGAVPSVAQDRCLVHATYVICQRGLYGGGQQPRAVEVWRLR